MSEQRIFNRDSFLDNIAKQLGRERITAPVARPNLKYNCHKEVFANKTPDELKAILVDYTETTLASQAIVTTKDKLTETLRNVCFHYCTDDGEGINPIGETIFTADNRLLDIVNPKDLAEKQHGVYIWDQSAGYEANIAVAERAKVGVVFAEQALAESGTMVLYSQAAQGRAVSLLPEASVFIVPKSNIVPRLTQATALLHQKAQNGERIPSCVNFISGPSSTADIELIKVVGVHGPVFATYIIIDDM
ncbi:LutC/YkgG family protein [Photobacterium phosphoreum]|uniref:LutC/YkgG family protein n=1 Tax=Photobacterium phosphoreum TaxID=659 RepID=UPI000D1533C8|nr:lactate utilization protein C [Photobacterium phosphoreum]PSU67932.1 lactate utilization protein C [Photobacterium phosphoreum]PSU74703.1 lactate utilization protein C [Photobacterium phosphoreum]